MQRTGVSIVGETLRHCYPKVYYLSIESGNTNLITMEQNYIAIEETSGFRYVPNKWYTI